jgi:DNA-binding response OmpR family regulator
MAYRLGLQDYERMILRILFVEKDITTVDLLVPSLERKGYQVNVAQTQRQATGRVRSLRPDLLIMDVASFGTRGYKVSEAVRTRLEGVPTILLLQDGHETAGSAAEAFMTPPFTSRKLLYRIRKVTEHLAEREIRAGCLVLDPRTRILRRRDQALHLRPKEAELLALFMRNPGRVISRRELMKQIWETDYMGDTRTLSVHVRWIRQKIEDEPSSPRYLRTVRGVGYRFEVPASASQA